jgi:hypothetical protein
VQEHRLIETNDDPRVRGARVAMDEYVVNDSLLHTPGIYGQRTVSGPLPFDVDGDDHDDDDANSVDSGND